MVLAAIGSAAREVALPENIPDFEIMKPSLAVRLYPEDTHSGTVEGGVWRRDFEGVLTVLVYDFPTHVEIVPRSHITAWRKTDEELFELGISNVATGFPVTVESFPEYGIHFLTSDEVYVTTLLYRLESFPEVIGRYGSLVSIPDRHTVVILPLEGSQSSGFTTGFLNVTLGSYMDADYPVSYHVWWYDHGGFARADVIVDGSMFVLLPDFILED